MKEKGEVWEDYIRQFFADGTRPVDFPNHDQQFSVPPIAKKDEKKKMEKR